MAKSNPHDATEQWNPDAGGLKGNPRPQPDTIGRYRIDGVLGAGGFGTVYLGFDGQLDRLVAIKVPHARRFAGHDALESYLDEARANASLDHPNIVQVFDVGTTIEHPVFIVSRYIDGETLRERLERSPMALDAAVNLVATLAEALHVAHQQGLVHRDVKPGNVMLDSSDKPYLVDFGLVLRDQNVRTKRDLIGTPAYMSPEQARGEGHRVDGRSDIFSLGIVLYELMVGHRPFRAATRGDMLDRIARGDVRPPRQFNDRLPRQLEWICLKALAVRTSDRYSTAGDFAADLHAFLRETHADEAGASSVTEKQDSRSGRLAADAGVGLQTTQASGISTASRRDNWVPVVPKGLRSFDEHDSDFFLQLLPGPRERQGLPESVLFWMRRLDETDADKTFAVGLLYGPSGCGKSSLVRAGLLPRLQDHVHPLYIEATADETELRILRQLRKRFPDLPTSDVLADVLAAIRRGDGVPAGEKVVLIFDQFEQWLHARSDEGTELADALRQCDGGRVQCLLLVRDDFWLSVSRFMSEIDIDLAQNRNMALVDLFDKLHARKVLTEYGIAFERLPHLHSQITDEQEAFLDAAVAGLAEFDKISPVRLALFAEMVKGRVWAPATLRQLGGMKGVGTRFLEEAFDQPNTPASHRLHRRAVLQTLGALLPGAGTDIKGTMRSYDQLQLAAGYEDNPSGFRQVLDILDYDLRLITPTDPEGRGFDLETSSVMESDSSFGIRYYQLAHDFLVPSIREWIGRHQQASLRGRLEHRLGEQAALWNVNPDKRFLPTWWEWAGFSLLTDRSRWNDTQRRMMSAANRRSLLLTGLAVVLIAGLSWVTLEYRGFTRSQALVDQLQTAQAAEVPEILDQLDRHRRSARPQLLAVRDQAEPGSTAELFTNLALVNDDPQSLPLLTDRLFDVNLTTQQMLLGELQPYAADLREPLWTALNDAEASPQRRFRAATGLAQIDPPTSDAVLPNWQLHAPFIADQMIHTANSERQTYNVLVEAMRPAVPAILAPLAMIFQGREAPPDRRGVATSLLFDLLDDDPVALCDTFLGGSDEQLSRALPAIETNRDKLIPLIRRVATESSDPSKPIVSARRRSAASALLMRFTPNDELWIPLKASPQPDQRTYLIHRLRLLGVSTDTIVSRLEVETDASIRASLIQALGEYPPDELSPQQSERIVGLAQQWYRSDPDAEIHSSAEFLLNRWGHEIWLRRSTPTLAGTLIDQSNWRVNDEGHTLVTLGSEDPQSPPPYEISTKEVTFEQYLRFRDHGRNEFAPTEQCPMNVVSWYDAAEYCRWLTEQSGLSEDDQCYPPERDAAGDFKAYEDFHKRAGYRLPTLGEWLYAWHSNTQTRCCFGDSDEYTTQYCWCRDNAAGHSHPLGTLKPSRFGIFGMLGNVAEWCNDVDRDMRPVRGGSYNYAIGELASKVDEGWTTPALRYYSYGFRIARSLAESP